jgi:2-methylcitrate dehydratase PrpD
LICALAVAHEVSARFGRAMADVRDVTPGEKISFPAITGYSSSIFGGTLASCMLSGLDSEQMANALGLAGHIAPAQSMGKWVRTLPATTDKYLMAGWICQAELLAVLLAKGSYRGDIEVLEGDFGFWRYMGSGRWIPEALADKLGREWQFPQMAIYKPYAHCRISQTVLDCLSHLIAEHQLQPEAIEKVDAYCDPHGALLPMWSNKNITSSLDAQMSVPFAVSLVVHRVKNGPEWQDPATLKDKKILAFMDKVSVQAHPEFERVIKEEPASRIGKVDVIAGGRKFSAERRYRKGSPATAQTRMTDAELIAKFQHNAVRVLHANRIGKLSDMILHLEDVEDVSDLAQMW